MRESRDRRMFTPGARRFLSLRFIVGRGRRPGDFSRVYGDAPLFGVSATSKGSATV